MKTPLHSEMIYAEHASEIIAKGAALIAASRPFALINSMEIEGGAARERRLTRTWSMMLEK